MWISIAGLEYVQFHASPIVKVLGVILFVSYLNCVPTKLQNRCTLQVG